MKALSLIACSLVALGVFATGCAGSSGDDTDSSADAIITGDLQGAERTQFLDFVRSDFARIMGSSADGIQFVVREMTVNHWNAAGPNDIGVTFRALPVRTGSVTPYDFRGTGLGNQGLEGKEVTGFWERWGGRWQHDNMEIGGHSFIVDGEFLGGGSAPVPSLAVGQPARKQFMDFLRDDMAQILDRDTSTMQFVEKDISPQGSEVSFRLQPVIVGSVTPYDFRGTSADSYVHSASGSEIAGRLRWTGSRFANISLTIGSGTFINGGSFQTPDRGE